MLQTRVPTNNQTDGSSQASDMNRTVLAPKSPFPRSLLGRTRPSRLLTSGRYLNNFRDMECSSVRWYLFSNPPAPSVFGRLSDLYVARRINVRNAYSIASNVLVFHVHSVAVWLPLPLILRNHLPNLCILALGSFSSIRSSHRIRILQDSSMNL